MSGWGSIATIYCQNIIQQWGWVASSHNINRDPSLTTLVNVYVALPVFTRVAGTSKSSVVCIFIFVPVNTI